MNIPLGKDTPQPTTYSPQSLSPIARTLGRSTLPQHILQHLTGVDKWTLWECSWLNKKGIPQHAVVQMSVSAHSPNIVESKSLKLYLNSLNNHCVGKATDYLALIQKDLTPILGVAPTLKILDTNELIRAEPNGICVDSYRSQLTTLPTYANRCDCLQALNPRHSEYSIRIQEEEQKMIQRKKEKKPINQKEEAHKHLLYSQLFRSLCPVTSQPDFALVYTQHNPIPSQLLLTYWLSFRNHQSFHEQCVEQMFCDFVDYLLANGENSQSLLIGSAFTRRGGLDIHPIRYHQHCPTPPPTIAYTLTQ